MSKFDLLDQLLEEGNGYITTSTVIEHDISKGTMAKYVEARNLERVAHGVYMSEDAWFDDYYLLYLRNRRIVFSQESALYLHGLMDREPSVTTVTVPENYNATHIKMQGVKVIYAIKEFHEMGITRVKTSFGNKVAVYDRERAICDLIRSKKDFEIQTFQVAMKEYMSSKGKHLGNLISYAKRLGVEDEVRTYTEVML